MSFKPVPEIERVAVVPVGSTVLNVTVYRKRFSDGDLVLQLDGEFLSQIVADADSEEDLNQLELWMAVREQAIEQGLNLEREEIEAVASAAVEVLINGSLLQAVSQHFAVAVVSNEGDGEVYNIGGPFTEEEADAWIAAGEAECFEGDVVFTKLPLRR